MQFTANQERALNISRHIVVNAGAGSGKTSVLVHRLLRILNTHASVDLSGILAITFTKKAASELKQRLALLVDGIEDSVLRTELKKQLASSYVSTIHGFCMRLVSDHVSTLGLDPHFDVMDDDRANIHWIQVVGSFLLQEQLSQNIYLKRSLNTYSFQQIEQDLKHLFQKRHALFECLGLSRSNKNVYQEFCEKKSEDYQTGLQAFLETVSSATSINVVELSVEKAHDLLHIFLKAYQQFVIWKHEHATYDYGDLILFAQQLFESREVRDKLRHQFKFIMIDECQDTDAFQWQLLDAICAPFSRMVGRFLFPDTSYYDKSSGDFGQNLFLVGDLKQSIYGFRGADPYLYLSVMTHMEKSGADIVPLMQNFRTQPQVISSLNTMFKHIFEDDNIPFHNLEPAREQRQGQVSFVDEKQGDDTHALAAHFLAENESGTPWEGMAVLFRSKARMQSLKQAFESYGIPVTTTHSQRFFQHQIVIDTLNLIKFLINSKDNVSLIGVLLSPLFDVSYQDIVNLYKAEDSVHLFDKIKRSDQTLWQNVMLKLESWIGLTKIQNIPSILEGLANEQAYIHIFDAHYGQDSIRHLHIFLYYLEKQWSNASVVGTDVVTHLQQLVDMGASEPEHPYEKPSQNAVHLLTIHASKGLEFSVVAILDVHKSFHLSKQDRWVIDKQGIGLFFKQHSTNTDNSWRKYLMEGQVEQGVREEKRLFYVACTRAKDRLLITGDFSKANKEKEGPSRSYIDFMGPFLSQAQFLDAPDLALQACSAKRLQARATNESVTIHSPKRALQNCTARPAQLNYPMTLDSMNGGGTKASQNKDSLSQHGPIQEKDVSSQHSPIQEKVVPASSFFCSVSDALLYMTCQKLYLLKPSLSLVSNQQGALSHEMSVDNLDDQPLMLFPELEEKPKGLWEIKRVSPAYRLRRLLHVTASEFGSLMHFVIELANHGHNDSTIYQASRQWLSQACPHVSLTSTMEETYEKQIDLLVQSYRQSDVYKRILQAAEAHHEWPLFFYQNKTVIEGRVDTIYRLKNEWHIVDYKSDAAPNLERLAYYKRQLGLYFLAINERFNHKRSVYKATLLFTEHMHEETVTFTNEELRHIQQSIASMPNKLITKAFKAPPISQCDTCPMAKVYKNCRDRGL